MQKVLITGGAGFIGSKLVSILSENTEYKPISGVRKKTEECKDPNVVQMGDIFPDTVWTQALLDVDIVVHLAARVHIMQDQCADPLAEYRLVNTEATLHLAREAADAGVRRFIFLSSIKVNGENTELDKPFTERDNYIPTDPYALSKYEAEKGLMEIAKITNMQVVIIRPPLVYGEGVKANFLNMIKLMDKTLPLPFGAIKNKRSLVSINNLVDFIVTCISHPNASNRIFLVSDNEDLSTTELLIKVSKALDKRNFLLPVPQQLLSITLKMIGKKDIAGRICGSLHVDISEAKQRLDWVPPLTVEMGLDETIKDYIKHREDL